MDPCRQILQLYHEEASTGPISVSHERRYGTKSRLYDPISRKHREEGQRTPPKEVTSCLIFTHIILILSVYDVNRIYYTYG